ncbi:laminin B domain-containing protein [Flavobacteriaceae bacterium 14752]|uniref:laminin B domain-containing protein n=1 Tax=Mesohalobacter salilacus TaxID=2491711 RepID=UPI000F63374A|nr:hypothetical protein EIG84_12860 [Flavobacteriaceae bacterium 14752]
MKYLKKYLLNKKLCENSLKQIFYVILICGTFQYSLAQTEAQNLFGIGLDIGLAEYGAYSNLEYSSIDQYIGYAQSRAKDNNCLNAQDIGDLRNRLKRTSYSRDRYNIIVDFRNRLYVNLQSCNCNRISSKGSLAQTEAQDIFGIGLDIGLAEHNAYSNNKFSSIDQYIGYAQSRARDNNCLNAHDIGDLRNRLKRTSYSRDRYNIIVDFRNRLYDNLQSCNCNRINNGGVSGGCKWRVNFGRITDRGSYVYTKAPSDGRTSYFIACNRYLGNWSSVRSISFEKRSWGGEFYRPNPKDAIGDIIIRNGSKTATYEVSPDHSGNWKKYFVPLNAVGWRFSGGAYNMRDVLSNITDFRIRAEYGAGVDHAELRNVVLNR